MTDTMDLALLAAALAAAGIVAGFLAGVFGIGGGAILVPVLEQVFLHLGVADDVRMHLSVGTSLAIIVPTSIRSFLSHRARGAVDDDLLRVFLFAVPAGVVVASLIFAAIPGDGLRLVFAAIAVLVGIKLLFNRQSWQIAAELPGTVGRSVAGVIIGFLSTLMGIGGGVLNNTFMTAYGRPIHTAVATSAGVGVLISVPGVIGTLIAGLGASGLPFGSTGFINWIAVALIIPLSLLAAPVGVRVAHALGKRPLEIAFGLFMLFVAARFAWSALAG